MGLSWWWCRCHELGGEVGFVIYDVDVFEGRRYSLVVVGVWCCKGNGKSWFGGGWWDGVRFWGEELHERVVEEGVVVWG